MFCFIKKGVIGPKKHGLRGDVAWELFLFVTFQGTDCFMGSDFSVSRIVGGNKEVKKR